jgi:hypothetical protein
LTYGSSGCDDGDDARSAESVGVVARFDSFRGTSKENIARKFDVRGANVFARKKSR